MVGVHELLIHAGLLIGLIFVQVLCSNHICHEFMNAAIMFHPEDTVLSSPFQFLAFTTFLSTLQQYSLSLVGMIVVQRPLFIDEHSIDTYSPHFD